MAIGDVNSDAKGSGARFNDGKADWSLLPLWTVEDELRVWMYGREKYAAWTWVKGMAWSVPFACLMRHMAAWQRGEECDAESGLPHLAHAACNLRMLTLYAKTYREGDDRPPACARPVEDVINDVITDMMATGVGFMRVDPAAVLADNPRAPVGGDDGFT